MQFQLLGHRKVVLTKTTLTFTFLTILTVTFFVPQEAKNARGWETNIYLLFARVLHVSTIRISSTVRVFSLPSIQTKMRRVAKIAVDRFIVSAAQTLALYNLK